MLASPDAAWHDDDGIRGVATLPTELFLACHAQAACQTVAVVGGRLGCTGLTAAGWGQARLLADRLAVQHKVRAFQAVYSSPRLRVVQTAEPVALVLGVPVTVSQRLREPDAGAADNRPWREVIDACGGPPSCGPAEPWAAGAEPWNSFLARATSELNQIVTRHRRQRILVVCDAAIVEAAHVLLMGLQAEARLGLGFVCGPASLTCWRREVTGQGRTTWLLVAHNDGGDLGRLA